MAKPPALANGARGTLCLLLLSLACSLPTGHGTGTGTGLDTHYYARRCRGLDRVVTTRLRAYYKQDPGLVAALLRLVFHDCFSVGCDASILLMEEVTHPLSETLNGFDVIEDLKALVEKHCPGVVSCADLLVLAARDAVRASGGPNIVVKYGRRDSPRAYPGAVSSQAVKESMNVSALGRKFRAIGLNSRDLVALSGAHTIGQAHCSAIEDRLSPKSVLPMNPSYKASLRQTCKGGGLGVNSPTVGMDPVTALKFDNQYYKNLLANIGLFTSDQTLMTDAGTARVVKRFAGDQGAFFSQFAKSFIKMTEIGVLTGSRGSIRKYCSMA